ncbi:MAG: GIY-YIG nuclease family protein [Novosphingobium sp.]|nr:GIY-YIG nuclease family protein [Novosphingobium sp.]
MAVNGKSKGIVYLVKNNINGKCYVGQTVHSLLHRKLEHLSEAKRGAKYPFHFAINKYGKDNFEWSILYHSLSVEELNKKEIYFIEFYNSKIPHGYNFTNGGNNGKGWKHSENTKRMIGEKNKKNKGQKAWNKGVPFSDLVKKKISISVKLAMNTSLIQAKLRKPKSEEHKLHLSLSLKGKNKGKNTSPKTAEHKEKIRQSVKKSLADPVVKAKMRRRNTSSLIIEHKEKIQQYD